MGDRWIERQDHPGSQSYGSNIRKVLRLRVGCGRASSLLLPITRRHTWSTAGGTPVVKFQASESKPSAASAEKQEENHNDQDKTKAAAAIVANSGAHVVAAAAENQQENHENEN